MEHVCSAFVAGCAVSISLCKGLQVQSILNRDGQIRIPIHALHRRSLLLFFAVNVWNLLDPKTDLGRFLVTNISKSWQVSGLTGHFVCKGLRLPKGEVNYQLHELLGRHRQCHPGRIHGKKDTGFQSSVESLH